jgi:SAM-dependent methyltransferase
VVLDLGSGSGNTVIAALDLFSGSRVIATDLSEHLLRILRDHAEQRVEYRDRILLVCQDASINSLRSQSVDLVLGGAILHHLLEPKHAILAALNALKPGGSAVFFEPFELGYGIIRLLIKDILASAQGKTEPLDRDVEKFLNGIDRDCMVRSLVPKTDPIFLSIDDKWMFTKSYFEKLAELAGARSVKVVSVDDLPKPFSSKMASLLRVGICRERDALPNWAWQIIDTYEESFSKDGLEELPIEACVIITK